MLKYVGGGWLPGVPARDLTDEEVKQYGGEEYLVTSGLYALSARAPTRKKRDGGTENKSEVKHVRN